MNHPSPLQRLSHELDRAEIRRGIDSKPERRRAGLRWGRELATCDSVSYTISRNAAKVYQFDVANPVISLVLDGVSKLDEFDVQCTPTKLTLTLKPGSDEWQGAKATFRIIGINGEKDPPPFDPIVDNRKGPRD